MSAKKPAKNGKNHLNAIESDDVIEIIDSNDEDDDIQSNGLENGKTVQKDVNSAINHNKNGETTSTSGNIMRPKSKMMQLQKSLDKSDSNNQRNDGNSIAENCNCLIGSVETEPVASDAKESASRSDANMSEVLLDVNPELGQPSKQSRVANGSFTQQLSSSSNTHQKKPIQNAAELHDFASQHRRGLKCHKRINGNWIEIKIDSRGIFHCIYCVRQFKNLLALSLHMKKSHKTDQYVYDCGRCLRQFDQKAEKDRHESVCEGHYYECHLCKVYVTKRKSNMQVHMRMHSGVKPFHCTVCNKSFQTKSFLRIHLNFIHNRINP